MPSMKTRGAKPVTVAIVSGHASWNSEHTSAHTRLASSRGPAVAPAAASAATSESTGSIGESKPGRQHMIARRLVRAGASAGRSWTGAEKSLQRGRKASHKNAGTDEVARKPGGEAANRFAIFVTKTDACSFSITRLTPHHQITH